MCQPQAILFRFTYLISGSKSEEREEADSLAVLGMTNKKGKSKDRKAKAIANEPSCLGAALAPTYCEMPAKVACCCLA